MLTPQNTHKEIQAVIDAGGTVEFAPGIYENAHYRINGSVHLVGNGATLVGGRRIKWQWVKDIFVHEGEQCEDTGPCNSERNTKKILCCDVPGHQPLRSLVVNGELRSRCRLPESGYLQHANVFDAVWRGSSEGGWDRKPTDEELLSMRVPEGALDGLTLDSAEVTIVHSWSDSMVRIVQAKDNVITYDMPAENPAGSFGVKNYCLWNVPEAFKSAGTFYHDTAAGKLYYRPLEGETEDTAAYLPEQASIFYAEEAISGVEIEGFTLVGTEPPHVLAGFGAQQITGAIEFKDVSDIKVHDMTITAVGGHGIHVTGAAENAEVADCLIFGVGAGGVTIHSRKDAAKSEVHDCHIHHVGMYYPSAQAISVGNCNLRHNYIHHTSYSAIGCGGEDFIVEKNFIHDTMIVLNDGAAVYSFGAQRGILRNNLVYGIRTKKGHHLRIAYYLDELTNGWLVEHNVALDCDYPNHNHMCGNHTYRENIFVNTKAHILCNMLRAKWKNRYVGNVFSAAGEVFIRMKAEDLETFENNRYYSKSGKIIQSLLVGAEMVGDRPFEEISDTNKLIEQVQFDKDQRIFTVENLTIDLTDVGPRQK